MAKVIHTALEEVTTKSSNRSAIKQKIERYVNENHMETGPGPDQTLFVFKDMRATLTKALNVLNNLKKLHSTKAELGAAMTLFNTTTLLRPPATEVQLAVLMKSMASAFDEYVPLYQVFINEGDNELVYKTDTSPETYDDIAEWLIHLVGGLVNQGAGAEQLLNTNTIKRADYLAAINILSQDILIALQNALIFSIPRPFSFLAMYLVVLLVTEGLL